MLKVGELVAFLKLDRSEYERDVDASESRFGKMGKTLGGIAVKAGAATAVAMGAAAAKGVAEFSTLERGMNEVFTLLPGISQDAMAKMTGQVRAFSSDFGALPNEVVPALYQSLSAGVPPDNVFAFLETAQKAALGGVTDLTTAVDGISSVVNAYGEDVIGAGKASDLMFTAVRLGKTSFEELSSSLFQVIPTAAALGVEFGDTTAALATMTAQGVPTRVATTQLRQAFVELSKDGGKTSDLFEQISGKTFKAFIAEGGNTADALGLLAEHADATGVGINDLFGSVEAGGAALALTGSNADAFRDAIEEMGDSAGATEAAYNQMDQGLGRSFDRLKAQASVLLGELGERLAPALETLVAWVTANMPAILAVIGRVFDGIGLLVNGVVVPAIRTVMGWLDNLRPVFDAVAGTVASFRSSSEGSMGGVMALFESAKETISAVMEAIGAVVSVVASFIQGVWERNGAAILSYLQKTWTNIQRVIGGALRIIRGVVQLVTGLLTGDWSKAWEGIKNILGGVWSVIQGLVSQAINMVRVVISTALAAIRTLFSAAWSAILAVLRSAWSGITRAVSGGVRDVLAWVKGLPKAILAALGNMGSLLFDSGKALLRGLINGIKNMAGAVKDAVKGVMDKARNLLPFSPAKEGPFSGSGWTLHSGRAISAALAKGIRDSEAEAVRAAAGLAGAVQASMPETSFDFRGQASGDNGRRGDGDLLVELDLGEGIRQRYRIERTREGRGRAVRMGAR